MTETTEIFSTGWRTSLKGTPTSPADIYVVLKGQSPEIQLAES
jgi:hypothetical protein